jgi:chromosome partitioning protein
MKTIAFFNNKGGVGKTSMVYHLAWMMNEMGHRVVAIDLDPQSNLTSAFLNDDELELLWNNNHSPQTILDALRKMIQKQGDIDQITPTTINKGLSLISGDLGLSAFEDRLSFAWRDCLDDQPSNSHDGFRVMSAFYRVVDDAATKTDSNYVLIDVGPNVGALNRAALVASDYVVVPLGADLFSLRGLHNLGPTLNSWRTGWISRKNGIKPPKILLPAGQMKPLGYVLLHPSVRENRPVMSYRKWADRVPAVYSTEVLNQSGLAASLDSDPNQLLQLKHFKSLMPMAQEARKPMFKLSARDGAIGGHSTAVSDCYEQFRQLAIRIIDRIAQSDPANSS